MDYKIISDGYIAHLEEELNTLAQDGWFVVTACTHGIILGRNPEMDYHNRVAADLMDAVKHRMFS